MCEFPPDFDYESLVTENDRIMKKLVSGRYSEDAADYVLGEYSFNLVKRDFSPYMDKVKTLLKRNLSEQNFIAEIQEINFQEKFFLPVL